MILYLILSITIGIIVSIALKKCKLYLPLNILIGIVFLVFKFNHFYSFKPIFNKLPSIFLAGLFASFILQPTNSFIFKLKENDFRFLIYTWLQFLLQWTLGPLLVFLLMNKFDLLSFTLPISFAGGHGSVIFVSSMVNNPYVDIMLMSATIGVFYSIIGGSMISKKRWVNKELSYEFDPYSALILLLIMGSSYLINTFVLNVPIFIISIVIAILLKFFKLDFNFKITSHLLVDLLIVFSIASINFYHVLENAKFLIYLSTFGLLLAFINLKFIAPKIIKKDIYEVSLFTWGWSLGGIGLGLGLIKNIDTNKSDEVFNQYARVYPYIAVVEVLLLVLVPKFFSVL